MYWLFGAVVRFNSWDEQAYLFFVSVFNIYYPFHGFHATEKPSSYYYYYVLMIKFIHKSILI